MKTFSVTIPTSGYVRYHVEAEDAEDAKARVEAGEGRRIEESDGEWWDEDRDGSWDVHEEGG